MSAERFPSSTPPRPPEGLVSIEDFTESNALAFYAGKIIVLVRTRGWRRPRERRIHFHAHAAVFLWRFDSLVARTAGRGGTGKCRRDAAFVCLGWHNDSSSSSSSSGRHVQQQLRVPCQYIFSLFFHLKGETKIVSPQVTVTCQLSFHLGRPRWFMNHPAVHVYGVFVASGTALPTSSTVKAMHPEHYLSRNKS